MSAYEILVPEDEEEAFAAFYRAHSEKLLRYCQYRLRDRHEAEDVVQEAFARAWRALPAGAPERNPYPWLRVVAANLCTDILRKRSRSEPVAVIELATVDGDMDRIADESDRVLVRQALGRLNDRHRSALMMRESEGLTYDQIAQRTGVTAGTVESLLWRARQALKREFTVLAGGPACLALGPALLLIGSRTRSAGRRAWIRIARRVSGLGPASDTPLAHAALGAVAALTVATGLLATVEMGGRHPGRPAVLVQVPVSALPRSAQAAIPPASSPVATAPASPDPPVATALPGATARELNAPTGPVDTRSPLQPAPLRLLSPVVTGSAAGEYAAQDPVAVHAGPVLVGVSPPAAADYLGTAVQRIGVVAPASTVNYVVAQEVKK